MIILLTTLHYPDPMADQLSHYKFNNSPLPGQLLFLTFVLVVFSNSGFSLNASFHFWQILSPKIF